MVQFIGSIFLAGGIISRWGLGRGDWLRQRRRRSHFLAGMILAHAEAQRRRE
ncbi:hypothetical protein [Sphaerospermopsis torques-reginae]|uniref:Uncharacterized protein n=1 Tax=Sphaerospermopsis torques-reginae ITEP-024 TaxID=984208 RepID=A0ABX8WWL3_9CYAN|nr:hypothetical protein [Sphaerospermopsis torques-reginae]QYX30772.1 hypothetical protein K2F26_18135 [Sphaerospermopsis torques-reginae ITEP-024]